MKPALLLLAALAVPIPAVADPAVPSAAPSILAITPAAPPAPPAPVNPAIDMQGYLRVADEAARYRESRRLTEAEFIRMSREPRTIVLDARSREKYDALHVKGAINLSFPDIAIESLARLIPDKATRILIYCINNFRDAEEAFPRKLATASLNLSTFIALYDYGYRNLYELGPLIEVGKAKLELVPSAP